MPSIDDQLRERIRDAAPRPAGADELFVRLGARKRRRTTTRRVGTVGLVVVVLAGTVGGFLVLGRSFKTGPHPAVTPPRTTNGALVLSIWNEDSRFLYVLPPDNQDLDPSDGSVLADRPQMRYLTGTGADRDTRPAVSPDGSIVAFEHHDFEGPGSLRLVNLDGSHARQIVPASVDVAAPAWSPDGTWIAFSATGIEGQPLGFVRPDGSDLVFSQGPLGIEHVSWSPDGTTLAFSALSTSNGGRDLWEANFDPQTENLTEPHQLTSSPGDEYAPTWSPDGRTIDFVTPAGIEQMPAGGGPASVLVPRNAVGLEGRRPTDPAWSPDGMYLTFVLDPPPGEVGPWVYALINGAVDPFPLAWGVNFAWQPVPASASPSASSDLGVGFPICHIMSMPIMVAGTAGDAYAFSKVAGKCPRPGEGERFIAADLDGDGLVDTPPVQLDGCFPPVGCETFAAPDVNADGTSEVAVSEAGADGYGVRLFALTTSPPAIQPIDVVDPQGIGNVQTGALRFAWVDVAGHAEGAMCESSAEGTAFTVFGYDKFQKEPELRTTTLRLDGATATVTGSSNDRVPLAEAPVPGNELCGAPLRGSAANFPNATDASGTDIGISSTLCDVSELHADFTGDGSKDTVWVGMPARGDRCSQPGTGTGFVAIDTTGDGLADGNYVGIRDCFDCRTYAASDLDGDGVPEIIVLIQASATPTYGIYEAILGPNVEPSSGVVPVTMTSDAAAIGLSAGDPVTLTAGGDEGYSFAVGCEGFPASPVLVQWSSSHPIEGPGSEVRDVYVTRLHLSAETATLIDAQHTTQPTSDPLPFDPLNSSGCGVKWFP